MSDGRLLSGCSACSHISLNNKIFFPPTTRKRCAGFFVLDDPLSMSEILVPLLPELQRLVDLAPEFSRSDTYHRHHGSNEFVGKVGWKVKGMDDSLIVPGTAQDSTQHRTCDFQLARQAPPSSPRTTWASPSNELCLIRKPRPLQWEQLRLIETRNGCSEILRDETMRKPLGLSCDTETSAQRFWTAAQGLSSRTRFRHTNLSNCNTQVRNVFRFL